MVAPAGERLLEHRVFEIARALARETGRVFFRSLARLLTDALPADFVVAASLLPGGQRVRIRALFGDGADLPPFEYELAGTPCANVISYQLCSYPRDVRTLFPTDEILTKMGAEGYVGCAINDSEGKCLGILAALTRTPLPDTSLAEGLLQFFALRAGAELEREGFEEALAASERRLREFTTYAREGIARVDLDPPLRLDSPLSEEERIEYAYAHATVGDCNEQAAALFGLSSREELIGAPLETVNPRSDPESRDRMRAGTRVNWEFSEVERTLRGRRMLMTRRGIFREGYLHGAWVTLRDITDLKRAESEVMRLNTELERRVQELNELQARLERDNAYLLEEIHGEHNFQEMVGSSKLFQNLTASIRLAAPTSATVLIHGESGTGKELVARAIHHLSPRRDRPLVKINCAAIPAALAESELFGHAKGAFTGATERRTGRFEYADGGTVFLDEITELPLETQAKLLRVLQEQEFEPVGSNRTVKVDVRVIAATNRRIDVAVQEGAFRLDLYYRLQVVPIEVPALRERREDIPPLAAHFVARLSRQFGRRITRISEESMQQMLAYDWPGNIRELENLLARAIILSRGEVLDLPPLGPPSGGRGPHHPPRASLRDAERWHIEGALRSTGWVLEGPRGAAALLKINPSTLRSRMKRLGIQRPQ